MTTRWRCFEVGRDDDAFLSIHQDFEAMVTADWASPEQVLVRDWIWPSHRSTMDRIGTDDRFALALTYDAAPVGLACCRCDRSGRARSSFIDFLALKRSLWESALWEGAVACVRDRLLQEARPRSLYFDSPAFGRFPDCRDILQRLGFTRFDEYAYFAVNLEASLPEVVEPAGYALVPWREEYRSRVAQMNVEMPVILGELIENPHRRLDRRASHVALQGEEACCGAILVREPAASGSSFVDYLLVADAHRRRGLGRALEVAAMVHLKARGIICLGSCVGMRNTAMLALKKELQGRPLGFADLCAVWNAPEANEEGRS